MKDIIASIFCYDYSIVTVPNYEHPAIELISTMPRDDDKKVVVQAHDSLMIFKWMKIDGQDGLGGGNYYGCFNFVVDGLARDPSNGEVCDHLLSISDSRVLRIKDVVAGLSAGEIEINLISVTELDQLIIGESLREARLRTERKTLTYEEEVALRRSYKHCGSCNKNDCYCIRS